MNRKFQIALNLVIAITALSLLVGMNSKVPFVLRTEAPPYINISIEADPTSHHKPHAEMPPFVISGSWSSLFFSSDATAHCSFKENPLLKLGDFSAPFAGPTNQCFTISKPTRTPIDGTSIYYSPEQWKRNYAGAFGGFVFGESLFTVNHGENKNELFAGNNVRNTINDRFPTDCWSGFIGGAWVDCNPSYNGFIYLEKFHWNSTHGWGRSLAKSLGPVIWPSNGYLYSSPSGLSKASQGVRHPSVFVDGEYVYIFYQDTFPPDGADQGFAVSTGPGRQSGIKVARATISSLENGNPFKVYWNGSFSEPALPANLAGAQHNPTQFRNALSALGPRGQLILPSELNIQRFAVAKIRNTAWYVAVVTYNEWTDRPKVALSFSKDLVNWSSIQKVFEGSSSLDFGMGYALPMSLDGNSNFVVEASGFFLVGVSWNGIIHRSKIVLNL